MDVVMFTTPRVCAKDTSSCGVAMDVLIHGHLTTTTFLARFRRALTPWTLRGSVDVTTPRGTNLASLNSGAKRFPSFCVHSRGVQRSSTVRRTTASTTSTSGATQVNRTTGHRASVRSIARSKDAQIAMTRLVTVFLIIPNGVVAAGRTSGHPKRPTRSLFLFIQKLVRSMKQIDSKFDPFWNLQHSTKRFP